MESQREDVLLRYSLIFFVIELAIFVGVSAIPINSPELVSSFQSEMHHIVSQPYFSKLLSIFSHNLLIALGEFVPIFGIGLFLYSIGGTAVLLSALANSEGVPGWYASLFLLTLPHSWLELPAYAIATASGLYLIIGLVKGYRGVVRRFFAMMLFVAIELFFAASIEAAEIFVEYVEIAYAYLFWFPAIPMFYALYLLFNYIQQKFG